MHYKTTFDEANYETAFSRANYELRHNDLTLLRMAIIFPDVIKAIIIRADNDDIQILDPSIPKALIIGI